MVVVVFVLPLIPTRFPTVVDVEEGDALLPLLPFGEDGMRLVVDAFTHVEEEQRQEEEDAFLLREEEEEEQQQRQEEEDALIDRAEELGLVEEAEEDGE